MRKDVLKSLLKTILFIACFMWNSSAYAQEATASSMQDVVSGSAKALVAAKDPETTLEEMRIVVVVLTADELNEVADAWKTHLRSHLEKTMTINLEIERAGTDFTGLRDELASLTTRTNEMLYIYEVVLNSWQRKGGDAAEIEKHRKYINALRFEILRELDLATLVGLVLAWVVSWRGGLSVLLYMAGFVISVWALQFVARVFTNFASNRIERFASISDLLSSFLRKVIYWTTFVFGVAMVLVSIGINITPAFAIFGGVSFVLGFAMQETLGNFASGLLLMIHRPFDTGDYVKTAGNIGSVDHMNIVSTKIRTLDNQVITIPNSKVWGDVITNFTASDLRRVDLVFGIGYSDDADLAIEELRKIVAEHPKCLSEPAAEVFVGELGDSSVNIFCRPWVRPKDLLKVTWDVTGKAKARFDAVGISIPFPQRDVHIFNKNSTD